MNITEGLQYLAGTLHETGGYEASVPFEVICPTSLINAYFEAMHFALGGSDDTKGYTDVSDSLKANAIALCERFYRANESEIEEGEENEEFSYDQLGHDLYFTTQGHGVGFWEKDYPRSEIFDEWVKANADNRDSEYVGDDYCLYSVAGDCDTDVTALRAEYPEAFR